MSNTNEQPIVNKATAERIWNAHREIMAGINLRTDIESKLAKGEDPRPLDHWGRREVCTLGYPSGETSHQLLQVEPKLAVAVIDAHIAAKSLELIQASIAAKVEMCGQVMPEHTRKALQDIQRTIRETPKDDLHQLVGSMDVIRELVKRATAPWF